MSSGIDSNESGISAERANQIQAQAGFPSDGDDAEDADSLLSKAMMELSVKDRNSFQEEIHGVRCLAPEESPVFLKESLMRLDRELNNPAVPSNLSLGFRKSQELFAKKGISTYVNTEDFRLRFLRCDTFDVSTAAERIFKYLNLVSKHFGSVVLRRPIRISDFSKEELRVFRRGWLQLLPFRDRAGKHGRRILTSFPNEGWQSVSSALHVKIMLYITYVVGEDIEAQKSGIVVVIWFDPSWNRTAWRPYGNDTPSVRFVPLGIRLSSVHVCTADTPLHRLRRNLLVMRLGKERYRVRMHVGQPMEIRYKLQSFGIPSDCIPISHTGTVKDKYVKEWIRLRTIIEAEQARTGSCRSINSIIECPYVGDIIFRNGTSLISHPANATLRSLVETMCQQESNREKTAKDLVLDIVNELRSLYVSNSSPNDKQRRDIRFLIWNEKECYWKPVEPENEEKDVHKKITRMVRHTRNLNAKGAGTNSKPSSTPRTTVQRDASFIFIDEQRHVPNKRQRMCLDLKISDCFDNY